MSRPGDSGRALLNSPQRSANPVENGEFTLPFLGIFNGSFSNHGIDAGALKLEHRHEDLYSRPEPFSAYNVLTIEDLEE